MSSLENEILQQAPAVGVPRPCSAEDVDPYETEDYQRYLAECAKHCECSHDICESVLAGAPCEMRIYDDDDADEWSTCPTCHGEGTSWDGLVECLDCGVHAWKAEDFEVRKTFLVWDNEKSPDAGATEKANG